MRKYADKIMIGLIAFYIICPIIIFLLFWTKLPIALAGSALLILLAVYLTSKAEINLEVSILNNKKFWLTVLAVIALWALFSGLGGFSYQTEDFRGRNPMFRDLCNYGWPVYYDLSNVPDIMKQYTNDSLSAEYVYYFAWWLPVAFCSKILFRLTGNPGIVQPLSDIMLYLWTVLGLFLIFYCLVQILKKYSYWILSSFILFGGFDTIIFMLNNQSFPHTTHIEWWAGLFQYTDQTAQLYWVFNQSIPIWLIISLLLLQKETKYMAGWSALGFAYSPFSTLGLVPIVIAALFNTKAETFKEKLKHAISWANICIPIMILIIFGSFYMLVMNGASQNSGFIFLLHPEFKTFTIYILFIIVEFLGYFFAMGSDAKKYRFYWVVLIELLLIPLYQMGLANDFAMRVSIPSLYILMILCLQRLFDAEHAGERKRKIILIVCLCIGYLTSWTEIQRNITMTLTTSQEEYIRDSVSTFANMETDDEQYVHMHVTQYMSMDTVYKNSFFNKYISKE